MASASAARVSAVVSRRIRYLPWLELLAPRSCPQATLQNRLGSGFRRPPDPRASRQHAVALPSFGVGYALLVGALLMHLNGERAGLGAYLRHGCRHVGRLIARHPRGHARVARQVRDEV